MIYSAYFFLLTVFLLVLNLTNGFVGIEERILDPPESVSLKNTRASTNLYFEQKIDNFNPVDTRTWKQRYHVSKEYYNESSKNHVFLLLGGEYEAKVTWLNYGAWIDTAKQYGALLIYLEHRYYGQSQPFSILTTENLQYLSVHQALEDTANFIRGINNIYNLTSDVKWILFGGSYAGNMAAWMRFKYPHLVAGAVASSAPLKAVLDFHQYFQLVRNSYANHSTACVDNIKEAFAQLENLVATCLEDTAIYNDLDKMFQLCDTIETSEGNEKDLAVLFEVLAGNNFAYVAQYNGRLKVSINDLCEIMVNGSEGSSMLQRLAEVNSLMLNTTSKSCTYYNYAGYVASLQNTTIGTISRTRQWIYQACTEFGFFQTSTQEVPIFGSRFGIKFFTDWCVDIFGENFNETLTSLGIQATNTRYKATNIATSNIVYFYGTSDPWHALGKLKSKEDANDTVIIVEGEGHCVNIQAQKETDSEGLKAARRKIDNLVGQWLTDGSDDHADGSSNRTKITESYFTFIFTLIFIYLIG